MGEKLSLRIKISEQTLYLQDASGHVIKQYPVSTSQYGVGNQSGSFMTPLGKHCIQEKIGTDAAENEVFVGRKSMGVLDVLQAPSESLPDDIITSRILWLSGMEPGFNQGGDVDSYQRYIYIHGTNDEDRIGSPVSHGCIRMRNKDVIDLYDAVAINCLVSIEE